MLAEHYRLLADLVLSVHVLFVIFVVFGLPLIVIGGYLGWRWVRYPVWRYLHLGGLVVVILQAWFGMICPLTTLEMWLRKQAMASTYSGSFIQHW